MVCFTYPIVMVLLWNRHLVIVCIICLTPSSTVAAYITHRTLKTRLDSVPEHSVMKTKSGSGERGWQLEHMDDWVVVEF